MDASGDEYRAAHTALSSLGALLGKLDWRTRFLPLTDADKCELTGVMRFAPCRMVQVKSVGNAVSGGSRVVDRGDVASSAIFDVAGTVVENKRAVRHGWTRYEFRGFACLC